MPATLKQYRSRQIQTIGFVDDPEPWFAKARVFIAPLRYGAGMKGKIGQSLSLGLPVVTTSVGAEGMHLEDGKNVLLADHPRDFAEAVVRLYRDAALWHALARNGREHVASHFSEIVARESLRRLLENSAELSLSAVSL
jgi:glycosyltransferase involved in cell wall biosynthesis